LGKSAYVLTPDKQPAFTYDAEEKAFKGTPHVASTAIGVGEGGPPYREMYSVVLRAGVASTTKYVGVNGFGVKTVVTKETDTYYVIWNDSIDVLTGVDELTVPVPPELAQRVKPNLKTAFVVTPSASSDGWVTAIGFNHVEPTISRPYEFITYSYGLWTSRLHVIVYDSKSGVVFLRKIINDGSTKSPSDNRSAVATRTYPPTVRDLFIPPMPVPERIKGVKLTAYFDVDEKGNATLLSYTSLPDSAYSKRVSDVLRTMRFRPGVHPDGTPKRDTASVEIIF